MQNEAMIKAIVNVMKSVKGIDKTSVVGTGQNSFKAVSDQDVKQIIGKAMEDNGLCIVPILIEPSIKVERWTENTQYGEKQKQQVFTEVKTKYLLMHVDGGFIEISGYGHGVDSQDKSAGKATTYALKYTLLYTFMVATGKIDDSDNTHSDEPDQPKVSKPVKPTPPPATKLSKADLKHAEGLIAASDTLEVLGANWASFSPEMKAAMLDIKDNRKVELTPIPGVAIVTPG